MHDTFAITIIFIALATMIGAFIRRRRRDKCLKDFSGDMVTLEKNPSIMIKGNLNVEHSALEFVYSRKSKDQNGNEQASYILYKQEYPTIQSLLRYHDELSEQGKIQREKELKKTYHPAFFSRLKRKIQNIFKTIRDSIMEVMNLLISRAQKNTGAGAVLSSQDKYVSQIKKDLIGAAGTSYEPLLEKYIGHKVVIEMIKGEQECLFWGVLKEYTANFIEIMDVDYQAVDEQISRKTDMVVPRNIALVRYLGE